MADPISAVFRQPFKEQVAAFRLRLGELVPTSRWDDISRNQHDRAFMVAGATKADLLADLAISIDKAITQGTSLEEFRKDFRQIVEKRGWHGWTGEGTAKGEAWRTKVIYRTNLETTRAAARYAQHFGGAFKYLVYRHSGAENYRPEHLAWDGLILPVDHPFWRTHYPINGWGCMCFVRGARTLAGAIRVGGKPNVKLPSNWDKPDPKTGAPAGIDRGWDYAPGATVDETIRTFATKPINWDYHLSRAFFEDVPEVYKDLFNSSYRKAIPLAESLSDWVAQVIARRAGQPISGPNRIEPLRTLGLTSRAQTDEIAAKFGIASDRLDIAIDEEAIFHVLKRHTNPRIEATRGQRAVLPDDFGKLAQVVETPDSITYERSTPDNAPTVIYRKRVGDDFFTAIFVVKGRRKRLALKTFFVGV